MGSSLQNVSRLFPVIAHAVAVFGDEQKATQWLSTPLPLLANRSPQDMPASDEELTVVEQTLTRIDHNISRRKLKSTVQLGSRMEELLISNHRG
jgi:putative toxin-antitoxin system antitoxin component (TIGR02293 family)